MIVIGTYVLNMDSLRPKTKRQYFAPLRILFSQQAARRMLTVALIYSLTSVLGKAAMSYTDPIGFGAFYYVLLAAFTTLVIIIKQPGVLKKTWHPHPGQWLVAFLMAGMILTHFTALALVETAYMIAVKRLSLLFGILYGIWLFNEHGIQRNLVAGSIVVSGVALILLNP